MDRIRRLFRKYKEFDNVAKTYQNFPGVKPHPSEQGFEQIVEEEYLE